MRRRQFLAQALGSSGMAAACLLSRPSWPFAAGPGTGPDSVLDLGSLEARHGGRLGVCAQRGGGAGARRVGWRAGERFAHASTFKLFLAACMLERVQSGQEQLQRPVRIRAADLVPHAPVTGPAVGGTLAIGRLCQAVVELSDNPAANILIRELGGLEPFQDWYRRLGDDITRIDRYEPRLNSAFPGDPRDTTTAAQTVANLDTVLLRGRLTPSLRALLDAWLTGTPTGAGRIKAALPAGWRLAHKTGSGGRNSCHDIGLAYPPAGDPVALAIYYTGAAAAPAELDAVVAAAAGAALALLSPHRQRPVAAR